MAVPEAQDFDDAFRRFDEIENAVGVFEDRQLLRLRIGRVPEITARAGDAGVAQLPDRFGGQVLRVVPAALGFIALRPVGGDLLEVAPRALRENYAEAWRGHRCCTFAVNSSALKVRPSRTSSMASPMARFIRNVSRTSTSSGELSGSPSTRS